MKHAYVSFCILILMIFHLSLSAQTSYTINSNAKWSSVLPSTCYACTITIASAATLTIDVSATCQNCAFVGGNVSIASQTLNIQYSGPVTTTTFNGTNLAATGTAQVIVNAPISFSNAIFTFNNTSSMTTSYNVSLTASTIYLYDNASMTSNGGAATAVSLVNGSRIVIGNGSLTSAAIFTVSGPTMTVYDNSSVAVANQNNVFYNWSSYNYQKNPTANAASGKAYNTSGLGMNCGSGYAHSCTNPSLFGPATLSSGVSSGATLPVLMDGFTAMLNSNHSVTLDWSTQLEVNFSHFTIQRSADGASWEDIGTVEAKGNSAVQTNYSYTDEQPLAGVNYYRLALADLDNTLTYTEVKVLQSAAIAKISFFPNPARDVVNVLLGGAAGNQVSVLLVSVSGQVIQGKKAVTGSGAVVSFPVQDIAAGMYILSVVCADGSRASSPVLINH